MDSKKVNNRKNPNPKIVSKKEAKPSYRVKRSTQFKKTEYKKLLALFQKHYPEKFQETADIIPRLSFLKTIKKEKKIIISDLVLTRFFYQYIKKQKYKSLLKQKYSDILESMIKNYPKNFAKDYSKTPTQSIFKKVKENKKINIPHLTMCRFFNQYLKKQKIFLRNREKKDKEILTTLKNTYPDTFPKDGPKLLKLGIFEDIQKEVKIHVTDDDLKAFLEHYTKSEGYLECYFTNPVRYDLKGNIVAPTTKQERFFAKKTLKKLQKKQSDLS